MGGTKSWPPKDLALIHMFASRKGRTWAIVVRGDSYESLFLPNSDRFSQKNREN